ncbi:hypothetical protein T484DRAFT_1844810, partial [Baffinella frigidus]
VPECKNSTFPYRLLQAPEHYWCDIIQQAPGHYWCKIIQQVYYGDTLPFGMTVIYEERFSVYYGDTLPIGMTVIYEERFSVPNASLPLATLKPVLETIFMRQFFFYPRFRNLLTANADLLVNTTLTISGLAGTLSPSGDASARMVFAAPFLRPVDNSLYPRVLLHRGEVECGVFDSPVDQQTIDQATDAIHAIEGASAPLFTYQPQVTVAEIVQHSPFPAVPNQVVFKLAFNLDLPSPSLITIHGLASARSVAPSNDWPCQFNLDLPSPSLITIHGLTSARSVAPSNDWPCQVLPGGALEVCEWDRPASADDFSGTLVLKTEGLFRGGVGAVRDQEYTVNVSLVNPPEAHNPNLSPLTPNP